jgi:hypothetical protein
VIGTGGVVPAGIGIGGMEVAELKEELQQYSWV